MVHVEAIRRPYRRPKTEGDGIMPKKCIAKVVLSREQKEILSELARRLGASESETLRMALMDYAKELSLIRERVHEKGRRRPESQ